MVSTRDRARSLVIATLAALGVGSPRLLAAQESTPTGHDGTPTAATPAATPAASRAPIRVAGRYPVPDDPDAPVIQIHFGNFALPPEYQYGYEVSVSVSGQATATSWPEGSRAEPDSDDVVTHEATLSDDDLQQMLADLDSAGFFALPVAGDPGEMPVGGEVDVVTVNLTDGEWRVVGFGLERDADRNVFAAAHEIVLAAIGVDDLPAFQSGASE